MSPPLRVMKMGSPMMDSKRTSFALSLAQALPEWLIKTISTKPTCMNSNKNKILPAPWGSCARLKTSVKILKCMKKQGSGEKRTGLSGCNMMKSERLSRKYVRICFWNCASASWWGAVIERLAYDFGVLCLQETRNTPWKATRTEWLPGCLKTRWTRNGDCIPQRCTKYSLHSRSKLVVQQFWGTSRYSSTKA